jgi:hypothetical protein
MSISPFNKRLFQRSVFFVLCLALSLLLLHVFIQTSGVNNLYRARFVDMVDGTAFRPYVNRALLPALVRWISAALPEQWGAFFSSLPWFLAELQAFQVPVEASLQALTAWALMLVSLVGFTISLRFFLLANHPLPGWLAEVVALLALACLPVFWNFGYIYDFTTLFLFTLQLVLLAKGSWIAYLFLFPLATLNKETSVLLILIYSLYDFPKVRLPRLKFLKILSVQVLIFMVIRLAIFLRFQHNPGAAGENHWADHWFVLARSPGVVLITFGVLLVGLSFLVFYGWREKPVFLRLASTILIPLAGLYFVYGFPFEFRVFYEAYPIIVALGLGSFLRLLPQKYRTVLMPSP